MPNRLLFLLINSYFSRTGFIYNTDLFDKVESVNNSENIKQAFKKLYGGCLNECLNIKVIQN